MGAVKSLGSPEFTERPAGAPIRRAEKLSWSVLIRDIRCAIINDGKEGRDDKSASYRPAFLSVHVYHATYSMVGYKTR